MGGKNDRAHLMSYRSCCCGVFSVTPLIWSSSNEFDVRDSLWRSSHFCTDWDISVLTDEVFLHSVRPVSVPDLCAPTLVVAFLFLLFIIVWFVQMDSNGIDSFKWTTLFQDVQDYAVGNVTSAITWLTWAKSSAGPSDWNNGFASCL